MMACAAALAAGCAGTFFGGGDATVDPRVNHLSAPANVDAKPSFSWKMESARQGAAQASYRIVVREGAPDGAVAWDSGEVVSGGSVGIPYAGAPLKSAKRYFWQVSVRDEKGNWIAPAKSIFETGLLSKDDWNGSAWISAKDAKVRTDPREHGNGKQEAEDGTSCFVKTVQNGKAVKEAFWTVTGLGVFEAYVNGEPVSRFCKCSGKKCRNFLKPGFTHYRKTKHSFTYDVTHLMKTGAGDSNAFAAEVSHGWWSDKIVNFFGVKPAFRAQLVMRYEDGTEARVGTDTSWLSGIAGPVIRAAIFDGEDYDARVKSAWMDGKSTVGFKASEPNDEFKGEIVPMEGAPIALRCDLALAPKEMYVWKGIDGADNDCFGTVRKLRSYKDGDTIELDAGETLIVDFAQNAAAVPKFEFSADAGTTLTMHPAEILNDGNGSKRRNCDGPEGSIYRQSYRKARTTLNYTFAGEGVEKYRPNFTFFGYRYASITSSGKVKIAKIRSIPVTSILKSTETGRLETGVADVNRLVSNCIWGQYSNYLSIPTDCPQRNERLGWTADTQVFAEAGAYNADTYGFFLKWMRDMRDTQADDGSFTGVAPTAQYGGNIHQLGWADAGIIVPYVIWHQFGDRRIVDQNWDSMEKYMKCIATMKYESKDATTHQWGDWLSYEKLESCSGAAYENRADGTRGVKADALKYWQYLGYCYWLWDARMMAQMAKATGRTAAEAEYRSIADKVVADLRSRYVDAGSGMLIDVFRDMQTLALFALKLGLLKGDAVAKTKAELLKNFKDHGDCLQTGFLGTSILMDTVTYDVGATEMAYTLLLQHKNPSWLYTVDQGATTFWERWNSYTKADGFASAGMNSFNHYAYGAVVAWMYGTMAGIQEDAEAGGYKHFTLAPIPDRRMGKVDASFNSPYGIIRSAWEYGADGKCKWKFTIPANTTATVKLPSGATEKLAAGTYERSLD